MTQHQMFASAYRLGPQLYDKAGIIKDLIPDREWVGLEDNVMLSTYLFNHTPRFVRHILFDIVYNASKRGQNPSVRYISKPFLIR